MDFLVKLIDANTLGGWVRAASLPLLTLLGTKVPLITSIFGADWATAASATIATLIVGIWSQVAKKYTA